MQNAIKFTRLTYKEICKTWKNLTSDIAKEIFIEFEICLYINKCFKTVKETESNQMLW